MHSFALPCHYLSFPVVLWSKLVHRYELIRTPEWKTYAESGQVPAEGERVFVKYNVDNRWYRSHIEEVKQVTVNVFSSCINFTSFMAASHGPTMSADCVDPCVGAGQHCRSTSYSFFIPSRVFQLFLHNMFAPCLLFQ